MDDIQPIERERAITHDHFWDPFNPAYLDFAQPFDLARKPVVALERFPELNCAATDHLDEGRKIRLANEIQRWNLSNILHGEQGALSLSASLCDILLDPDFELKPTIEGFFGYVVLYPKALAENLRSDIERGDARRDGVREEGLVA
jgi:hypothetical protein